MIKFHGRSKFKQFFKDKPTKWGFKTFILADSVNYNVHSWKIYEGKEDKPVKKTNTNNCAGTYRRPQ